MPRGKGSKQRQSSTGGEKKGGGRTVCALCGRTIKESGHDQPVIYSICPTCKKLPHRNPGPTGSPT